VRRQNYIRLLSQLTLLLIAPTHEEIARLSCGEVGHPSTNRDRRRSTSLVETFALVLRQTAITSSRAIRRRTGSQWSSLSTGVMSSRCRCLLANAIRQEFHARIVWYLHCALSLAQCIVLGPVCVFATGGRAACVCLCVFGSVTTITQNCVHRSSPNWVCRYR